MANNLAYNDANDKLVYGANGNLAFAHKCPICGYCETPYGLEVVLSGIEPRADCWNYGDLPSILLKWSTPPDWSGGTYTLYPSIANWNSTSCVWSAKIDLTGDSGVITKYDDSWDDCAADINPVWRKSLTALRIKVTLYGSSESWSVEVWVDCGDDFSGDVFYLYDTPASLDCSEEFGGDNAWPEGGPNDSYLIMHSGSVTVSGV